MVTLHTVLPQFSDEQADVLYSLCGAASAVTVFTNTSRRLLLEQDLVPASRLHVVAHGAPAELYAATDSVEARARFLVPDGVPVMSTFGLLSRGKGIELAIEAMALLAEQYPDLHYVVAGRTHPEVARIEGETYRTSLQELAGMLGVDDRVMFVDRFLNLDELKDLLGISDVVCTPSCSPTGPASCRRSATAWNFQDPSPDSFILGPARALALPPDAPLLQCLGQRWAQRCGWCWT